MLKQLDIVLKYQIIIVLIMVIFCAMICSQLSCHVTIYAQIFVLVHCSAHNFCHFNLWAKETNHNVSTSFI